MPSATRTPGEWGVETPVGEGQVDWHAFIKMLAGGDYIGDMYIEREGGDDRLGDVKKAIDFITRVMADLG